jgi:hypothetical protein
MVTFDIDTDGQQTEEEVIQLLKAMLNSGSFSGYRTSPDGFEFRRIRGNQSVEEVDQNDMCLRLIMSKLLFLMNSYWKKSKL